MRVWKPLLAAAIALATLLPAFQLLRTHQPWNCFALTWDESFYLQAIHNFWSGRGFRPNFIGKPFDPGLTIGLPMAWGVGFVRSLTGWEWALAGRLWVYLNTFLFLVLVALWGRARTKDWATAFLAVAIYGVFVSRAPNAPYVVYGVLGEMPGAVLAFAALWVAGTRAYPWSGPIAFLAYWTKPSYALLMPCLWLASAVVRGRREWKGLFALGLGELLPIIVSWVIASIARQESLGQYLATVFATTSAISPADVGAQGVGHLAGMLGRTAAAFVGTALVLVPAVQVISWSRHGIQRSDSPPAGSRAVSIGEWAAWLFLVAGLAYFTVLGRHFIAKHAFVFAHLAVAYGCVRVAGWLGPLLSAWLQPATLAAAFFGVCFTWALHVPWAKKTLFEAIAVEGCAFREQRYLEMLVTQGLDAAAVAEPSSHGFVYGLGERTPPQFKSWSEVPRPLPRFVYGDWATLRPWPRECSPRWSGKTFGLLDCAGEYSGGPAPESD